MNFEDIKTEWQSYSKKLDQAQRLNEQVIASLLKERSRSRVSTIRRNQTRYLVLMMLNLLLIAAIFIGNPFDFTHTLQFVPFGLLAVGIAGAVASLLKSIRHFSAEINLVNLDRFLKSTIQAYETNKKMERWVRVLILTAGLLTALSFLPHKLEQKGLAQALLETGFLLSITLVIYFMAFRAGVFKNSNKDAFASDLQEWHELKQISSDLSYN